MHHAVFKNCKRFAIPAEANLAAGGGGTEEEGIRGAEAAEQRRRGDLTPKNGQKDAPIDPYRHFLHLGLSKALEDAEISKIVGPNEEIGALF